MVGDDGDRVCNSLKILADYCKKLTIIDVIVLLGGGEGVGEVSTGVQI